MDAVGEEAAEREEDLAALWRLARAERIDERLPYIDSGYVPEEDQKKADEAPDVLGDLAKNLFGKKE